MSLRCRFVTNYCCEAYLEGPLANVVKSVLIPVAKWTFGSWTKWIESNCLLPAIVLTSAS